MGYPGNPEADQGRSLAHAGEGDVHTVASLRVLDLRLHGGILRQSDSSFDSNAAERRRTIANAGDVSLSRTDGQERLRTLWF